MGKKKKEVKHHPDHWIVVDEIKVNGRILTKGTEFSIVGESGRFIFTKHVTTPTASWVDCVGGAKGYKMMRSFSVDRIKRVHYKNKTMDNIVKERKEQKKLESDNAESD